MIQTVFVDVFVRMPVIFIMSKFLLIFTVFTDFTGKFDLFYHFTGKFKIR
jgi:hypothetical protein